LIFLFVGGICWAEDTPHFVFTPGTELAYRVEVAAFWRDPKLRDIPNWEGELKVWPIEKRADGTTLVRARLVMNTLPLAPVITRDDTVAWAEFSVGANGVADYDFAPRTDETPTIRLAFPMPPPLMLNWHEVEAEASRDFSFAPDGSPEQKLWTILIDDHDPFLSGWKGTQRTVCTFDARAGRVLKLDTRADFLDGVYIWRTTKVTFESERTLEADEAARIKHDSAELAGALAQWQALAWESHDPVHELGDFLRLLDASQKRIEALPTVVGSAEFGEDTRLISPAALQMRRIAVDKIFTAREALLDKPSPDWTAMDADGHAHALKDFRGRVVVLDAWPNDTAQVRASAPLLEKIAKDYAAQPVTVIGVNRYTSSEAMPGVTQLAGGPLMRAFNMRALPGLMVIDAAGVVRFQHAGWDDATYRALRGEIDGLLKTKSGKF
jgi:hypothetical protein